MAGGNFVSNCLALHERILHTDYSLAKKALSGKLTIHQRFGASMYPAIRSYLVNGHWEYCGWYKMGDDTCGLSWDGGVCETYNRKYTHNEIKEAHAIGKEIANQNHYHMTSIDRGNNHRIPKEIKMVHVRSVNANHLSQIRNDEIPTYNKTADIDCIDFDMDSILKLDDFYQQLCKVTNYLQVADIEYDLVGRMLATWLPSISLITNGHIGEHKDYFKNRFNVK